MLDLTKDQLINWLKDSGVKIIDLLTEELVKEWCYNHGFTIIETKEADEDKLLDFNTVVELSCNINCVNPKHLKTKKRGKEIVYARWLVFLYYTKHSRMSLANIGAICNRDHATVIHAMNNVDNKYDHEWRRRNLKLFRDKVDEIHEKLGIDKRFTKLQSESKINKNDTSKQ